MSHKRAVPSTLPVRMKCPRGSIEMHSMFPPCLSSAERGSPVAESHKRAVLSSLQVRDSNAVGMENDSQHAALMPEWQSHLLAGNGVPDAHVAVDTAGGKSAAVAD